MTTIPRAKIKALGEALDRDGKVTFKNGATIERVSDVVQQGLGIDEPIEVIHLRVTRPAGGVAFYGPGEMTSAYRMALDGPKPKEQPTSDKDFGEDAPW